MRDLIIPYKYRIIKGEIDIRQPLKVLDLGCGHNSFNVFKRYFMISRFDGVEKEIPYGKEYEYEGISNLFLFDLESELEKIDNLADKYYDLILMSHIIEHTYNGDEILAKLIPKLSSNGIIYLEFPSEKTLKYPSGIGFFNFHDDPSHKKVYSFVDISNILLKNNCVVIKAGIRRDPIRLLLYTPLFLLWNIFYSLPFKNKWDVRGLWDFFGIAQFVLGKVKPANL